MATVSIIIITLFKNLSLFALAKHKIKLCDYKKIICWMDPDYEQRLLRQINGLKTPTKNSPIVS